MRNLVIVLFAITISVFSGETYRGWEVLLKCRKNEGNLRFSAPCGKSSRPVVFLARGTGAGYGVRVSISQKGMEAQGIDIEGRSFSLAPVRNYPAADEAGDRMEVEFKIRDDEWSCYIDGVLRGSMAAPFGMPGEILWPKRPGTRLLSPMRFLPVPRVGFKTDFMIEPGAPNELYPWVIQYGSWRIHTAQQEAVVRPETDQKRAKEAPLTADKSPNFYSLKGGGQLKEALITTGYDFYDNYSLTGSIQLDKGEAGLVFCHRDGKAAAGEAAPDPAKADFYALTVRMDTPWPGQRDIKLWRQNKGVRKTLARASVPLYNKQWYLPGIKVHGDEIICELDHYELFRVKEQLPSGGKIGLYAKTEVEIRFDDVTLEPYTVMDLSDVAGLKHNALYHSGGYYQGEEQARMEEGGTRVLQSAGPFTVNCHAQAGDEMLVLGRRHNKNMFFTASVTPAGQVWSTGLVMGWSGMESSYFRYELRHEKGQTTSRLLKVNKGELSELDKYTVEGGADTKMELMADCTEAGKIRCYHNGLLIHYYDNQKPVTGGSGVWLGAGSKGEFGDFKLSGTRTVIKELEQKNPIFREDSFMRHWASPEGQWVNGGENKLWHKGDFFGDFVIKMPIIAGSELHIAVPDGKTEGRAVVRVSDKKIELGTLLKDGEKPEVQEHTLEAAIAEGQSYELKHEGSWLWLEVNGKTVIRQRLDLKFKAYGTRVLAKNMTLAHMSKSKVTRANIIDEYFNESPHDWIANGGDWQIINRFQCTPSWSHMIGEATSGMGAFWRKQVFSGDMTLEFYAGTRHGHYDQAGNLNCTIMAQDTTPHSGYTVACTEWDQNLSQNWTTFYKNGESLAKTDSYLVPRRRKGMYRRILNPLVSAGRPIHGAWFYIKQRKIGDKLEYYFDDELIFTQKDPEAIQEGLIGIWTFVHSITLAQIKVTFDSVKPRPLSVTMLPAEEGAVPSERVKEFTTSLNGFPADSLNKGYWSTNDNVGQSVIRSFPGNTDGIVLENKLGSGEMKLTSALPSTLLSQTAGWRFKIKRTKAARFNFFYSIGKDTDKGFVPQKNYFHVISGDRFSGGAWKKAGESNVEPVEKIDYKSEDWTTVTVWIPSSSRQGCDGESRVKIGGFGLEQLDAMANGIWGNVPGSAYAVSELRPIFYGRPSLSLDANGTGSVRSAISGARPTMSSDKEVLQNQLKSCPDVRGVSQAWLEVSKGSDTLLCPIEWIDLPPEMPFSVQWSKDAKDAIMVSHDNNYTDPRMAAMTLSLNGKALPLTRGEDEKVLAHLNRSEESAQSVGSGKVSFKVSCSGKEYTVTLDSMSPIRRNSGPVLLNVKGLTPFFMTFEGGLGSPLSPSNDGRMVLGRDDSVQGNYFIVRNTGYGQTLATQYNMSFSISNYPLAQFRYRAWDMAHVSLSFSNHHYVQLSNNDSRSALPVRSGKKFVFDEQWHSWTGMVSDAFTTTPYSVERFLPKSFKMGSIGSPDQTGRYSKLNLDDFVFGPAVKDASQLCFTPEYFDQDGVLKVRVGILPGETEWHDRSIEEQNKTVWQEFKPGEKLTPKLPEGIVDGISHVVFYAEDKYGNQSPVMDVPFLLDRKALAPSVSIQPSNDPLLNGTRMAIVFNNHQGAPWNLEKATFHVNGKAQTIPHWTNLFVHSRGNDALYLNHPFIFRNLLNASKNGDEFKFEIDGIEDGAGNPSPRVVAPFKVDYASDKTGPSWYTMSHESSVNWFSNWDGHRSAWIQFTPGSNNNVRIVNQQGTSPHLIHHSYYSTADLTRETKWQPSKHPCISFRLATSSYRASAVIRLVLACSDGTIYTISLIKPGTGGHELNRTETFTWANNSWKRFTFNVRDLLAKAGVSADKIKGLTIKSINFQRRGLQHNDNMSIDDVYIHGMPEKKDAPDLLKWIAFDASGIASLEATAVSQEGADQWSHSFTDLNKTDLNVLRGKFKGTQWFRCQAKDKAGNLSTAFWMPLFSE